jgi:hypothetical protein
MCLCVCGRIFFAWRADLVSGNTKSCGCQKATRLHTSAHYYAEPYSMPHHPKNSMYKRWNSVLARCMDANHQRYKYYGGVGVQVCERWQSFELFFEDLGFPPFKGASLDRYPDPAGHYAPGNVRWATPLQQRHNRRLKK